MSAAHGHLADAPKGSLEIGINPQGNVVCKLLDGDGVGHIIFSPEQARQVAVSLIELAYEAERQKRASLGGAP